MNAPTDWLITTAGQSAAGLLIWSWQALALLALAWLALKICRMKSPALRHQVWLIGLVAVAALPLSSLTRIYKTTDRVGEPITLQQLAQQLKGQALRKN